MHIPNFFVFVQCWLFKTDDSIEKADFSPRAFLSKGAARFRHRALFSFWKPTVSQGGAA